MPRTMHTYAKKSIDPGTYLKAKYDLKKCIDKAKAKYSRKLDECLNNNNSREIWKGIGKIANYKKSASPLDETDTSMPDKQNHFYSRFDSDNTQPTPTRHHDVMEAPFKIEDYQVKMHINKLNERKAAGPDGISPRLLKVCCDQLAPILTDVFNWSLETRCVPKRFKEAVIVPVPKTNVISSLNDCRPVAITPAFMKVFEENILHFLKSILPQDLDLYQFAYRSNRCTEDAVTLLLHNALHHLEPPRSFNVSSNKYARLLFIDYSSAFNTIIPAKLHAKLLDLGINNSLSDWLLDFLLDRTQVVRIGKNFSDVLTLNTGTPQGCVLSPTLYNLFTYDCAVDKVSTDMVKFADDTTLCGHITDNDEGQYREEVTNLVRWCDQNNLLLNVKKTKEMIIDFKVNPSVIQPLIINDEVVERVNIFKFLGVYISSDLKWDKHIEMNLKKAQQKMYFLRLLKSFGVRSEILINFYRSCIESFLSNAILVWFNSATQKDRNKLNRVIKSASYIIGKPMQQLELIYEKRVKMRTSKIMHDIHHPSNSLFDFMPSGRRLRSYGGSKSTGRFLNSFFPTATRIYNKS